MSGCLPMRLLLLGLLALSFFDAAATEIVRGTACYRFSDNESLNAAREIALSMAKRDALESNSVFVESTSNLENMTLKNDLITNLTAGYLKNLKVTGESEDFKSREICRSVSAEVEPVEVKKQINAKIRQFSNISEDRSGLPVGKKLKIVNAWEDRGRLYLVAQNISGGYAVGSSTVKFYDDDGYPSDQTRKSHTFYRAGDFYKFDFWLKTKNYTIEVD